MTSLFFKCDFSQNHFHYIIKLYGKQEALDVIFIQRISYRICVYRPISFYSEFSFGGGRNSVVHACSTNHGGPFALITDPETVGLHITS